MHASVNPAPEYKTKLMRRDVAFLGFETTIAEEDARGVMSQLAGIQQ
jgi:hypothetical protein